MPTTNEKRPATDREAASSTWPVDSYLRDFQPESQTAKVTDVAPESAAALSPSYQSKRRSARYKLDVPLRVILHEQDKTLIRDGRGTEVGEYGMCVLVGMELKVGGEIEIEFTLPYSGVPIRVSGAVRNRTGYRYGCEFVPDGQGAQKDVARLRQVLQTFAADHPS